MKNNKLLKVLVPLFIAVFILMPFEVPFAFSSYFTESNPATTSDWPMFMHDLNHTGYNGQSYILNASNLRKVAEFTTGAAVYSSPAIFNGTVYMGSTDFTLYALNASNISQQIANFTTGGEIYSTAAVSNNIVYIGSWDNNIYALNASNLYQFANFTTGGDINSSPVVYNSIVYVGSDDSRLYALNSSNLYQFYNFTTGAGIESVPAVVDGIVYVGSDDFNLYALNASNISEQLSNFTAGARFSGSPLVSSKKVYIGSGDDNFYALNASNISQQIANFTTGAGIFYSPAIYSGKIYISSDDNNIYALNASNLYQFANFTTGAGIFNSPIIKSGTPVLVYVGSTDSNVYALNSSNLYQFANFTTGAGIFNAPASSESNVYVGSEDGKIYALTTRLILIDNDGDGFYSNYGVIDCDDNNYNIVTPSNNYAVNRSVTICPGTYSLASGIRITSSNVAVQCNNATINGSGTTGTGVTVSAQINVTILNCIVTRYSTAISFTGTNNSLINNNSLNYNAAYGISLSLSRNNILTNNTANSNRDSGAYLSSSLNNTLSYNFMSSNEQSGIYLYTGSNNTISYNTLQSNIKQGIYLRQGSNSNNISNNAVNFNLYAFNFLGSSNNNLTANTLAFNSMSVSGATGNNLQENILQDNLQVSTISEVSIRQNSTYLKDEQINLSFNFLYLNGSRVASLTYIVSVYPSTNYSITVVLNQINISFIPNKTGEYTVSLNLTDDKNNSEKKNYAFLIGNISYDSYRYYMHQNLPTHGQAVPAGTNIDAGSMFSHDTLSDTDGIDNEIRSCSVWIQYSPDEIVNRYLFIKNISVGWFYKMVGAAPTAIFQKYATYGSSGDNSVSFPATGGNYTFNTTVIPNINFNLDYAWGLYWTAVKLMGTSPGIVSNATHQSYVDFIYGYVGPNVVGFRAADNDTDIRRANILSSYFENDEQTNATMQLEGEGNITVIVNMTAGQDYTLYYDGIECGVSPSCTINQISGSLINVTVELGSEHTISITGTPTVETAPQVDDVIYRGGSGGSNPTRYSPATNGQIFVSSTVPNEELAAIPKQTVSEPAEKEQTLNQTVQTEEKTKESPINFGSIAIVITGILAILSAVIYFSFIKK